MKNKTRKSTNKCSDSSSTCSSPLTKLKDTVLGATQPVDHWIKISNNYYSNIKLILSGIAYIVIGFFQHVSCEESSWHNPSDGNQEHETFPRNVPAAAAADSVNGSCSNCFAAVLFPFSTACIRTFKFKHSFKTYTSRTLFWVKINIHQIIKETHSSSIWIIITAKETVKNKWRIYYQLRTDQVNWNIPAKRIKTLFHYRKLRIEERSVYQKRNHPTEKVSELNNNLNKQERRVCFFLVMARSKKKGFDDEWKGADFGIELPATTSQSH